MALAKSTAALSYTQVAIDALRNHDRLRLGVPVQDIVRNTSGVLCLVIDIIYASYCSVSYKVTQPA